MVDDGLLFVGVVPVVGVVVDGVVVVPFPTVDGLGDMVLGAPVTDDGVLLVPVVPVVAGAQFADWLLVVAMLPVDEFVPLDVVVLGEAVVPEV